MSASGDATFVPLSDRVRWTAVLRGLLLVTGGVLWWSGERTPATDRTLAAVALAYALLTLVLVLVRRGRSATRAGLDVGLLLDSVVLVAATHLLGGLAGPVATLFALHAAGTTLLTSFRTGVKVAGTHTVLVLALVQAEATGVLPPGSHSGVFPANFTAFTALLWATTLGTATFAAVNERELRRRRRDTEVLHHLLVRLTVLDEPSAVTAVLTEFAEAELAAVSAEVVLAGEGDDLDAVLVRAEREGRPVLVAAPDPDRDPRLHRLWPRARGVVVVPLPAVAGRGWLVADLGEDRRGLERRALRTLEQAVSHTAMALSRARAVEALRRAASLDGLTGVANRRTLDEALAALARAGGTRPLTVALLDVDHFKAVNDRHGHQTGDEVLRAVAAAAASVVRGSDLLARYGGEEFALVLPGTTTADAQSLVERLRAAVSAGTSPRVTCSVGLAGGDPARAVELLAAADRALYAAKAAGRDRSVVADAPTGSADVQLQP